MATKYQWIPLSDFRGGQNATDAPVDLGDSQVVLARNGDTFRTKMFRKRSGAAAPNIGSAFSGILSSLIAHYPDNNPAHAELWGVDDGSGGNPIIGRMAAASTFSAVTLLDAVPVGAFIVRGASYNGKLFLAYGNNGSADCMHVWDPNLSVPQVRKVGYPVGNAPTVADNGPNVAYPAIQRFYRVRYRIKHGAVIDAQSEPTTSVAFTPDGAHTSARVTQGAALSILETHWVVEGSADNVTFYELAEIAIGTTTFDDTAAPNSYAFGTLSAVLGAFIPPIESKYVVAAFNRVLFAGSHYTATTHPKSRVTFTPAKGTADKGDDERVPNTLTVRNWVDLDEGIGGDITGFAGPIYGSLYVFKYARIKQLTPTGTSSPVFDVVELSPTRGALEQECICVGEDAQGHPTVFFMDSQVGPMMLGATAPIPIGDSIRNLWDTVNLAATAKVGQIVDYPAKGQVWFWVATGASNDPTLLMIYTKQTGGWDVWDTGGVLRLARCAVLFSRVLGASMSRDKVPYTSQTAVANTLLRADTTDLNDAGTNYQAMVKTRPYAFNKGKPFRTTDPWVLAKAASGVTLTVTVDADFGREVKSNTIDLTPTSSEAGASRVFRKVQGLDVADAAWVQYQIADDHEIANGWQIEQLFVPVERLDIEP